MKILLEQQKTDYAIFNHEWILQDCSRDFKKRLSQNQQEPSDSSIWSLFPELVGSEEPLRAVQSGSLKYYLLQGLSRLSQELTQQRFYDLCVLSYSKADAELICLLYDSTELLQLQQRLQQQENEIKLLKSGLLRAGRHFAHQIIGDSPQIERIRSFIKKISNIRSTTILLTGESGTGKNLVARAIHFSSALSDKPFVEINCAALPPTLLESELFGYEKGAFTNALSNKKGLLEEADGGTLFLDEISELPLSLQAKFLTFIETKSFRRLGSTVERTVKTRIITATNRDLKQAVEKKEFRSDLLFRINVLNLNLPPLRELDNDVVTIANNFVSHYALDFGKHLVGLSDSAKEKLLHYSWPGNVRELRNVIERAAIFADGPCIDAEDILINEPEPTFSENIKLDALENGFSIYDLEKELIVRALKRAKNNQTQAAKLLGLSLDTLRYRIKKYDIVNQ
ncbi:sigma-54-dependent Fis family transcriptional regulator [candidate division KSB1 bacterium]|nr:sigma-54-dependent Fis family transcriptional regulator [candidate division KSB1 bacterium]